MWEDRFLLSYFDGIVQERPNSIANVLELRFFLHKPIDLVR